MTPSLYPGLTLPAYFEMDGIPVRILRHNGLPERLRKGGVWEPFADPQIFSEQAFPIDKDEFDGMVSRYDSGGTPPRPVL